MSPQQIAATSPTSREDRAKDSRILIVEDTDFSRALLEEIFKKNGFENILLATNGREGLFLTESHHPDLVILDLIMPDMDGMEYCKVVRRKPAFMHLPILVQSAVTDSDQIAKAFQAGATDFINKPINPEELLARSKIHLENRLLLSDLDKFRKRVQAELETAREMQETIMPSGQIKSDVKNRYHVDIQAHFEPSSEIGGDFWGVKPLSDHTIAFYNVDFSGHGVSAAINTFRLHTMLQETAPHFDTPAQCVSDLNERLVPLLPTGQYATFFYGVLDTNENKLRYCLAGAPHPLLLKTDRTTEILSGEGVPLGISSGMEYEEHEIAFDQGDTLILYSDALIEVANDQGEFLTKEQLACVLEQETDNSASSLMVGMLGSFDRHRNVDAPLHDDLTLCLFRRL